MLYGGLICHLRNGRSLEEFDGFSSLKLMFAFSHVLTVANTMIMTHFYDDFVTNSSAFVTITIQ